MYTRSPLLHDHLNGPKPERNPVVDALTARISSILNTMDRPLPSAMQRGGVPAQRPFKNSDEMVVSEITRIQDVVTELISLFQDYRMSIDSQLERLCVEVASLDVKVHMHIDSKITEAKQSIMAEVERRFSSDMFHHPENIQVIKETIETTVPQVDHTESITKINAELDMINQAEVEIIEKINAISASNAECHQAAVAALHCLREVINR